MISNPEEESIRLDPDSFESIDAAFSSFVDDMFDILSQENFNKVHRKCLENLDIVGGISYSMEDKSKIINSTNVDELFSVLCNCKHFWNWMNIRILEKMAGNSIKAKEAIKKYKKKVFSRKVKDVISEIPNLEIPTDKYTEVKEKWNKDFDDLTIKDIVKHWNEIEKKFNINETMLLKNITDGCVEVCWLLHNDLVQKALCSATSQIFPEVLYLKIGNFIIKDDITGSYVKHISIYKQYLCTTTIYGTAQRQLDTGMRAAGSAPEGDINTSMWVPIGIFPVSNKARVLVF